MSDQNRLEVIDKDGWQKTYHLEKSKTYIGRGAGNDIRLDSDRGVEVADLHAQLLANGSGYQLVNLANVDILLGPEGNQTLPPRSAITMTDGTSFLLGEFTLVFRGGGAFYGGAANRNTSKNIGLTLSMAQSRLTPHRSLDGVVIVQNLGERSGVKFELALEGLAPECFDLEPGPLLSSGAEQEVLFRLHHRGAQPPAGETTITIQATAPRAYSADFVAVSQTIQVLPYYRHRLDLLTPDRDIPAQAKSEELQAAEETLPIRADSQTETAPAVSAAAVLPVAAASLDPDREQAGKAAAMPEPAPPSQPQSWWSRLTRQKSSASSQISEQISEPKDKATVGVTAPPAANTQVASIARPEHSSLPETEVTPADPTPLPQTIAPEAVEAGAPLPTETEQPLDTGSEVRAPDETALPVMIEDILPTQPASDEDLAPPPETPQAQPVVEQFVDSAENDVELAYATEAEVDNVRPQPPESRQTGAADIKDDWWPAAEESDNLAPQAANSTPPEIKDNVSGTTDPTEDIWGSEMTDAAPGLERRQETLKIKAGSTLQTANVQEAESKTLSTDIEDWWAEPEDESSSEDKK